MRQKRTQHNLTNFRTHDNKTNKILCITNASGITIKWSKKQEKTVIGKNRAIYLAVVSEALLVYLYCAERWLQWGSVLRKLADTDISILLVSKRDQSISKITLNSFKTYIIIMYVLVNNTEINIILSTFLYM